jgi:hypothetical protein
MELFSLRKIHRICPRHRGPGPPATAHGSTDFIKHWSLATRSMAQIKPIKSESLLGCLDLIWRWVAIGSPQLMQESPGADSTTEVAGSGRGQHQLTLTEIQVFSSYGGRFSIRFARTGSQRRGERVYANLNRRRAATKPSNREGGLRWSFGSNELPSSFSTDQLLRSAVENSNFVSTCDRKFCTICGAIYRGF